MKTLNINRGDPRGFLEEIFQGETLKGGLALSYSPPLNAQKEGKDFSKMENWPKASWRNKYRIILKGAQN